MDFTEEHKARIAAAVKASWTDERKAKLREARLGANNPFYGKHHKDKSVHGLPGKSNPFYGKKHSDETKSELSTAHKGRAHRLYRYGITDEQYAAALEAGLLWCSEHKDFLSQDQFVSNKGTLLRGARCRECARKWQINKNFGVTPEWFDNKLQEQKGTCALCHNERSDKRQRHLCIDHDHKTGKLRGLLCNKCNSAIERLDEVTDWADKAKEYLRSYR